jgi:hypothetical protein
MKEGLDFAEKAVVAADLHPAGLMEFPSAVNPPASA